MDQRYYKESDIELLKKVKHLKEQGFQLKAIKMILANLNTPDSLDPDTEIHQKKEQDGKVIELFRGDRLFGGERRDKPYHRGGQPWDQRGSRF